MWPCLVIFLKHLQVRRHFVCDKTISVSTRRIIICNQNAESRTRKLSGARGRTATLIEIRVTQAAEFGYFFITHTIASPLFKGNVNFLYNTVNLNIQSERGESAQKLVKSSQ